MKNKILSTCLCINFLFGATAFAADKTINYDLKGKLLSNISLECDSLCKRPTITLLNSDKTRALYVNDGIGEETEEGYILKFDSFKIPSDVTTGALYLIIGGEDIEKTEATISYKAPGDIYDALKLINAATAETIHTTMLSCGETAGADLTYYRTMPENWYSAVDGAVSALDLSVSEDYSDLYEKQELYLAAVNKISDLYVIAASEDRDAAVRLIKNADNLGFDRNEYYAKADAEEIAAYIKSKNIAPDSAENDIAKLFDESVALQCIKNQDWKTTEQMLKYYQAKERFSYDFAQYDALSELNKIAVIDSLKKASSADFAGMPTLISGAITALPQTGGNDGAHQTVSGGGGGGGSYTPAAPSTSDDSGVNYTSSALKDLNDAEWARSAIETLYGKNIVSGFEDGNYYPNDNVTREQFVKTVVTALGLEADGAELTFSDVGQDAWYYRFIKTACNAGIVTGIGDNKFGIGMNITREDMAVIICRTLEYCGIQTEEAELAFTDSDEISDYAKQAVAFLSAKGIINGMGDGSFAPKGLVTRAQMAVIVCNTLEVYQSN